MYNDILLNNNKVDSVSAPTEVDLDTLFDNLTNDVENVNKFISNLSQN